MISKIQRYFLEKKNFLNPIDLNLPDNHKIILDEKKVFHLNKFFYKQIGIDHYWRDRLLWSDKEWFNYVSNKNLETHILKKEDNLVGYYEQEYHPSSNEVELINMGVLKEFRGIKLGSVLLNHAIASASRKNPIRMWVHTCSLDHKNALLNYKSKGFAIFKEEEIDFVA
jgi:GNAT superfamily N-acetyltransferase